MPDDSGASGESTQQVGADASGSGGRVAVILPVWNSARWLPDCLAALGRQSYRDFEVVIVDNGSTDGGTAELGEHGFPLDLVTLSENAGFAAAVNLGIRRSKDPFVALLNADTRVEPEWLERLVGAIEAAPGAVAAVAPCMLRMDDPAVVDNAGDRFSWYGSATKIGHGEPAADHSLPGEITSVSAGAALYRRSFFDRVGLFDERFESYLEDVDIGLRGRLLGFRYLYEPEARVLHAGHGSGLARGRYVRLVTRNRLLVQLKNLPGGRLLRHAPEWLWGQLYFLIVSRRPLQSLAGYLGFLTALPHALRERRRLRASGVIAAGAWEGILSDELGEPSLRELIARRRRRLT